MLKCRRKNCGKKHKAFGLCRPHYQKFRMKDPEVRTKVQQWRQEYNKRPWRRFYAAQWKVKKVLGRWDITYNRYKKIIKNPCHYCGNRIDESGSGIDRVNNNLGYITGNVVSCCGICNRMKSSIPLELFLLKIIQIFKRHGKTI